MIGAPRGPRAEIAAAVDAMRAAAPLVHGATGSVTRALVADGLLAAGARPMLTESEQEAPTLVGVAQRAVLRPDGADGPPEVGSTLTTAVGLIHGSHPCILPAARGGRKSGPPAPSTGRRPMTKGGPAGRRRDPPFVIAGGTAGRPQRAHFVVRRRVNSAWSPSPHIANPTADSGSRLALVSSSMSEPKVSTILLMSA